MKLEVQGGEAVEVADSVFGADYNETLVHQVVVAYMAAARSGTKAQKTRSDVRGGGRKPWRQKGTGRARAGTIRSPIWVGGGRAFAARPRDYGQKVNRKMYRAAMRAIWSELARQGRLVLANEFACAESKTRVALSQLGGLGMQKGVIVLDEVSEDVHLSTRNIPHIDVVDTSAVDPVSLVGAEKVLLTVPALRKVEEWLQ